MSPINRWRRSMLCSGMHKDWRPVILMLLAWGACQSLGCGSAKPEPQVAPVSGQVTYRGKPLKLGQVVLVHDSGKVSAGEIASDGRFKFDAIVGPNKVVIICAPDDGTKDPKSLIPVKYTNDSTSGLTLDVVDGENQKDWELTD